jgi:uncharacterized DUF497 family protein
VRQILKWDKSKNEKLILERDLSFDLVAEAFDVGAVVMDMDHPDTARANQRMLLIKVNGYICAVPYVQDGPIKSLKTMYYSRKYDELYGDGHGQEIE